MSFNPADKDAHVTLSGANLIATSDGVQSFASVRGTVGKTTGKWYFEMTIGTIEVFVGIGNSSATLSSYAGSDGNAWGWWTNNGNLYHSGSNSLLSVFGAGDVVGVAFEPGATLQFYKNGSAVGSPIDISSLTGTVYPMATVCFFGTAGAVTLNESPASPPSGYSAIGGGGGGGAKITLPLIAHIMSNGGF